MTGFQMKRIISGTLYDTKTGEIVTDVINAEANARLRNHIVIRCENCGHERRVMQYKWDEAENGGWDNKWFRCFACDRITTFRKG